MVDRYYCINSMIYLPKYMNSMALCFVAVSQSTDGWTLIHGFMTVRKVLLSLAHWLYLPATALYKSSCLIVLAKFSSLICEKPDVSHPKLF